MNKYFLLLPATVILMACSSNAMSGTPVSTAAEQGPAYKVYGDSISAEGAMPIAEFSKAVAGKDSMDAKISAEIITSCSRKGCWMDVKMADGTPMKVRFRDYSFFVPTKGLAGKQAILQGRATKEVTDVAMLRHYAEDAGQSKEDIAKITEPETSWSFLADGVLIKE